MASSQSVEKTASRCKVKHYDFDPDATTETFVTNGWQDMRDFGCALVQFFRTIGTSTLTLALYASESSSGAGSPVLVKSKTFTAGQPDAVGDQVFLECTAEEIRSVDTSKVGLRYLNAKLSFATNTDEGVVGFVLTDPRFEYSGLTSDVIA